MGGGALVKPDMRPAFPDNDSNGSRIGFYVSAGYNGFRNPFGNPILVEVYFQAQGLSPPRSAINRAAIIMSAVEPGFTLVVISFLSKASILPRFLAKPDW